jgi:sterol desaturase/sphingolipid hydroxylase (fatty acid hydroxylase superfamily)
MLSIPIVIAGLLLMGAIIAWEILHYRRKSMPFPYREALVSLAISLIYQISNVMTLPVMNAINGYVYGFRIHTFSMDQWHHWVLLILLVDFLYYWLHRSMHGIRWMWASHVVHHSPVTITFSGAYRISVTSILSMLFIFYLPLYFLGFPPSAFVQAYAVHLFYQFWLHTDLIPKLGWLEYIFNTPSHHRVHHAVNPRYIDKNHGGIFIIYDRLFGTFQEELDSDPCRYGLVGHAPSHNILKIFFQEWWAVIKDIRTCRSPKELWMATLAAPGAFQGYRRQHESGSSQSRVQDRKESA